MRTTRVAAGLVLIMIAAAFPAASSAASAPHGAATLPDFDSRDAAPPLPETAALSNARASLGAEGVVSTDRYTGGVRMVGRTDGFLTEPSSAAPDRIGLDYVADHPGLFGLDGQDLSALRVTSQYASPDGITHTAYIQTDGGIAAYDNYLVTNVAEDGQIVNILGGAVGDLQVNTTAPKLSAGQALGIAAQNVGGGASLSPKTTSQGSGPEEPTTFASGDQARLVLFNDGKTTRLAWRVWVNDTHDYLYEVVVDAVDGTVLARYSRTDFASGSVFDFHPGAAVGGTQHTVSFSTDPTWLTSTTILSGNNTHAYADTDGVNGASDPSEEIPPSSGTNWNYPITIFSPFGQDCPTPGCTWDSGIANSWETNRNQTTTNLFYLVNKYHDHLKANPIGFTHASRNFEVVDADGPGGSGLGGDPVLAESNDFSGFNNANFSTVPDGTSPHMQMYRFTDPSLQGSDDADVVFHEYTHGLSNRLIGNGSGLTTNQAKAMGEGWSDWYAIDYLVADGYLTDTSTQGDLRVGDYVVPGGIRYEPMDCAVGDSSGGCTNAGAGPGGYTYGDISTIGGGFEVHNAGEFWAQTLWDIRKALGSTAAEALITSGMRLTPNAPSMIDARNAILQADVNGGGSHYQQLWHLFAVRGLGYSATTPSSNATTATEAFDEPGYLTHDSFTLSDPAPGGDGDGIAEPGETVNVTETVKNNNPYSITGATGVVSSSLAGVTVPQPNTTFGTVTSGATKAGSPPFQVKVPAALSCGDPVPLSVAISSNQGSSATAFALPTGQTIAGPTGTRSPSVAIPDNSTTGLSDPMTFTGVGRVRDVNVTVNITHTWDQDLQVTLISPGGTSVPLVLRRGSSGDNFTNTIFDDQAATPISTGSAPFTGSFQPEAPLSAINGEAVAGTWTLNVADVVAQDTGTLNSWSLQTQVAGNCSPPPASSPPTATTKPATAITSTGATLNASINPNGAETVYRFEYGKTTSYGTSVPTGAAPSAGSGTSAVNKSLAITGLQAGTTYHYRVRANNGQAAFGADQTFTTPAASGATVVTNNATNVTANGATLNASINPNGLATVYRFEYGTTTSYGKEAPTGTAPSAGNGNAAVPVSAAITGLMPGTTYHYRVRANNGTASYSADKTFTTPNPPTLVIKDATGVTGTGATLNASINPNGQATVYRFEYGTTTSYGKEAPTGAAPSAGNGTTAVNKSAAITGLVPGTTYHYRIRANNGTSAFSADKTFTTPKPPTLLINDATGITATGATLNASINPNGQATVYRFEYGLTTSYGKEAPMGAAPSAGSGSSAVSKSAAVTGLQPGTTYHYRVRANNGQAAYSADKTFTTLSPPTVVTNSATNVTATGATLNATINPNGLATAYRFEYGTTTAYGKQAPGGAAPSAGSGSSAVARSAPITGLMPGTTYHYRVRANNGTAAYGADKTFTTPLAFAPQKMTLV